MSKMNPQGTGSKQNQNKSTAMAPVGNAALDAAVEALKAKGFEAAAATAERVEQTGDVVRDKDLLCGVDLLIFDIRRKMSEEYGGMISIVKAMLRTSEVVVFTDGSTGVHAELEGKHPTPQNPLLVIGGLRKSTYDRKKYNPNWDRVTPEEKYLRDEAGEYLYETHPQTGARLKGTTYHIAGDGDPSKIQGLNRNGAQNRARMSA